MGVQIASRLLTAVGVTFMRSARMLAMSAYRTRMRLKHQIINGFILRASGQRNVYIATVMDLPGYVFFGGSLSLRRITSIGLAVPVGIRDDFDPPGSDAQFQVMDRSSYFLIPVATRIRQAIQPFATDWLPLIQQSSWLLGYSRMDVPALREFPDQRAWYLDDETYFTYDCIVALAGSITSLVTSGRSITIENGNVTVGEVALSYFLRNQYSIDELDLPDDWKLYPRRLVPRAQCAPAFAARRYPGITISGYAILPASDTPELEGIDLYCHVARTFRQHQDSWGDPGSLGYDRYGEQGMLVAVGRQDRTKYQPLEGTPVFAETQRMVVVVPIDIAQAYLHPTPENLPADESGRPELPNFGTFYTPTPVACGGDFAVFSAYTTFRDLGGENSDLAGDAWSLLTSLPDGRTISLRADWNASGGEIETGVPGEFMQPWIVGGAYVPGPEGEVAHCLVWEQTFVRAGTSRIKGEWALYSTAGDTPTRQVMSGGAPLFALLMGNGPTLFDDSNFDTSNPMSAVFHAGDGKLVTSATDYPPAANGRPIRCMVVDTATAQIDIRGVIAVSSNQLDKCFVTVLQPFMPAAGQQPPREAVLLATVSSHQLNGSGEGQTYLSVDGGHTWRLYITDAGAQGGAFYVGNRMWRFSLNNWLDGRARA